MANVNVKFNNKEFLLSCEDGQEEHLEELSFHLNEKFNKLKSSLGNIGENKLLLITSISTMDEYFETKKKVDQKIGELKDLTELNERYTSKFKHPFIMAVTGSSKAEIIKSFSTRIENDSKTELKIACEQVEKIALIRIKQILEN